MCVGVFSDVVGCSAVVCLAEERGDAECIRVITYTDRPSNRSPCPSCLPPNDVDFNPLFPPASPPDLSPPASPPYSSDPLAGADICAMAKALRDAYENLCDEYELF